MKHISNRKKSALGVCLLVSQLLTFQGAWAQPYTQDSYDNSTQFQSTFRQNRQKKQKPRFLILDQLNGGEVQVSASAGYAATALTLNALTQTGSYKVKTEKSSLSSDISVGYGLTDNFYSKLKLNYENAKNTQSTTALYNATQPNQESITNTAGLQEPSVLLGAQAYLGSTQLFAELSIDIPIGDKIEKRTSYNEISDNNLEGGMRYSPHVGIVQDLGSVLVLGAASYTIKDERTEKFEDQGYTTTKKVKGGNTLNVLTGIEFKNLSRLGFVLGYQKIESADDLSSQANQVSTSPETSQAIASTYLGFKVGSNSYLIPKLSYATDLDKKLTFNNGNQLEIKQADALQFDLGARVSF